MRNIFLEKSYIKCGRKTIPGPFPKKSKLSISLNQKPNVFYSFSLLYTQLRATQIILKLSCRPLAFILYMKLLKKQKEAWNQSTCLIFCKIFKEKYFSCYILLTDQTSLYGCLYFVRMRMAMRIMQLFVDQAVTP